MPIFIKSKMALAYRNINRFSEGNLVCNEIGDKACKWFIRAEWKKVKSLLFGIKFSKQLTTT